MTLARKAPPLTREDISREWDAIATTRHRQIISGTDLTYHHVLLPSILRRLSNDKHSHILDLGCGTGYLAGLFGERAGQVTGIDPSMASLSIARSYLQSRSNISLVNADIESYARDTHDKHDIVIANMVLMDCLDLDAAIASIASVLQNRGRLIATITHPWFWPRYWGYENENWFKYRDEIVIQAPFAISAEPTSHLTTHVHRPLERYLTSLYANGLVLAELEEPYPPAYIEARYPSSWQYPRYITLSAIRA